MSTPQVVVGMDGATAPLASALRPTGARWAVTPNEPGSAALVARFEALQPTLLGLAATGGDHRAVGAALAAAACPLGVVNPRQGRACAQATGQVATPEPLAARAVAPWAEAVRPEPRPLPDAPPEELRALRARRRQLSAMRTAAQPRLEHASPRLRADITAHLAWLAQRVAALDKDRDTPVRASAVWREREPLDRSVPGLGPVWARPLGLDLPELGTAASAWQPWWASRRASAPGGPCEGPARPGGGGPMCGRL